MSKRYGISVLARHGSDGETHLARPELCNLSESEEVHDIEARIRWKTSTFLREKRRTHCSASTQRP